jgi:hypothetical protein
MLITQATEEQALPDAHGVAFMDTTWMDLPVHMTHLSAMHSFTKTQCQQYSRASLAVLGGYWC